MRYRSSARERDFHRIYELHGPAVHAYLARRVAQEHVEDLAAETFTVAWRKLPRDAEEPLPWLYGVARREVLAHRRRLAGRRRLVERLISLTPLHAERDFVLPAIEPVLAPPLARAFARLSDIEKEALLLVAWEHLDHAQAGGVVGCSAATFAVRVSRARSKLRAALEPVQPAKEGMA
jgi:RNA polymerase sigma factor (sigma-70 family)